MQWVAFRNAAVLVPRCRPFTFLLRRTSAYRPLLPKHVFTIQERKLHAKAARRYRDLKTDIQEKDNAHIMWWKEKMQMCRRPSSVALVNHLSFTNLLGLDTTLKSGSLKEGNLNSEIMQIKSEFPCEVLLCRVGDFYEAIGCDAYILVEYAGLNPFGGLRSEAIPKAGCPVVNLHQTLDDLTRNGFSVNRWHLFMIFSNQRQNSLYGELCILMLPCDLARMFRHAHPGSPYVYGLVADDRDIDFPDPMPVVGISRSAKGYCMLSVLETMKTYSIEDGLTEEALVTKLRTCRCHLLFLHGSVRHNSSGTCRWGEYGEGGLLWGECTARQHEWFDGNPANELLSKVKELYGLEDDTIFRNVTVVSDNRPSPLHLGTDTDRCSSN